MKLRALLMCSALMTIPSTAAFSQGVDRDTAPSAGLEEIVVTAQKRVESLQDTPLAVSAVTAATIEARGITSAADLSGIAPNLVTTTTPSSTANMAIYIRGIGDQEPVLTVDAPIGLYVDGVVIGRTAGSIFDLVDLDRIEVLRGPQGTLYGRNTTGGAVNLIAKKPADEFGAEAFFSYGNLNAMQARIRLDTGELGNTGLKAKFSYLHKQRDGYYDNILTSDKHDPGAYNTDAFRIALSYDQGGAFRANYSFDYNDRDSWAIPFQMVAARQDIANYINASSFLGGSTPIITRNRLKSYQSELGPLTDKVRGHALTLELDVSDNLTIKSLTGYRKWNNTVDGGDLDGNAGLVGFVVSPAILAPPNAFIPLGVQPINLFTATNRRGQHQWSQEINLLGNIGDRFEFVVGGFYFDEKANERNPQSFTLILPSPVPIPLGPVTVNSFGVNLSSTLEYRHVSTSKAIFGQGTYDLTDKLSITGGVRYTKDKKHITQTSPIPRDLSRSFDEFNWSGSINYEWSNDILTYARVATGYKAGGFNARSANAGFDPEKIISYEVGFKSELFDRRLRFNLAAFYASYKDLQIQQFQAGSGGATSITVNAGKATYQGVEAELMAHPVDGLTLNGSLGYVDRDYKEFLVLDPATNMIINVADEARFGYSSSLTANVGAQYEFPLAQVGTLTARLDYNYRSSVYWHPLDRFTPFNPLISQDGYGLLDGRLTLSDVETAGGKLSVALWGKNLTNKSYLQSGIDFGSLGFAGAAYAEGRTYGVDVKLAF